MTIELDDEERALLKAALLMYVEYYRSLAGHSKCSEKTRRAHEVVERLWKLTQPGSATTPAA